MKKTFFLIASLLAAGSLPSLADFDDSPFIPLWQGVTMPGKPTPGPEEMKGQFVKGKEWQGFEIKNVSEPTLQFYKAEANVPTAAIIVCPGGAYRGLQYGHEGVDIANHLQKIGVSAFILKYRVPNEFNDKDRVYMDAQRAIRLIRYKAKEWNVDPDKVGFMGFSAGGHLTVWMSGNADQKTYEPVDDADKMPTKPNFAVMVYPAWLDSRDKASPLTLAKDIHVTAESPRTFIIHNMQDTSFYKASIAYFLALQENGVPVDFHMFNEGGHGHGMHPKNMPVDIWFQLLTDWLRYNGYAPKA
jgi:acetyl esterase/lipase